MKKNLKRKKRIFHILTVLILCFFSAFTFSGCLGSLGGGYTGGGSSGGGSGGSSGGSTGGGSSGGGSSWWDDDYGDLGDYSSGMEEIMAGAIGIYELDPSEEAFYDKYASKQMSFEALADRQFDTMATFLYESLNKIYGVEDTNNTSFDISGYGSSKIVNYDNLLTNANQAIIAKLSSGELANSSQLNYYNAINGGYAISVTDGNVTYNTDSTKTEYAWKNKDSFDKDSLKNALIYIYKNIQTPSAVNDDITFTSDVTLKSYYSSFASIASGQNTSGITQLRVSREYMWNVAYYLAYTVIGESNINNSINAYNTIFDTTNSSNPIKPITSTNSSTDVVSAFEKYKGYNDVIGDLVNQMSKMSIGSGSDAGKVVYLDTTNNANWETTLFPQVTLEKYVFYSDVADVCDAYEDDDFGATTKKGDAVGTLQKIKKILYIPNLTGDESSVPDLSWMLSFKTETGEVQLKLDYTLYLPGENNNITGNAEFGGWGSWDDEPSSSSDVTDYITITEDYSDDPELFELSFEGINMGSATTSYGNTYTIDKLLQASFTNTQKVINYSNGEVGEFEVGLLNVYSPLFNNGTLAIASNYIELNFNFFDNSGNELNEIPGIYITMFDVNNVGEY